MSNEYEIVHDFFKQAPSLHVNPDTRQHLRDAIDAEQKISRNRKPRTRRTIAVATGVAAVLAGSVSAAGVLLYVSHQTTKVSRDTATVRPSNVTSNNVQVINSSNGPEYKYTGVASIRAHAKFPFVLPVGLPQGFVQQTPTLEDNTHRTGGVNPKQQMAMWIVKQGTGTGAGAWEYSISEYAEPTRKDGLWIIEGVMRSQKTLLKSEVIDGVTVQYAQLRSKPRRVARVFFYKNGIFYALAVQHGTNATDTQVVKSLLNGRVIVETQ